MVPTRTVWAGGRGWTLLVLLLSLPSLVFLVLHTLYTPGRLPEFLDLAVVWILALSGIAGAVLTLSAIAVSVIAKFQNDVPRGAKVAMWSFVSLSILACLYLAQVPA